MDAGAHEREGLEVDAVARHHGFRLVERTGRASGDLDDRAQEVSVLRTAAKASRCPPAGALGRDCAPPFVPLPP